jgi:hypothetical protein
MIRIIEEIDVGAAGSKMWIEPVHYGNAEDLATRINELFELGKGGAAVKAGSRRSSPTSRPTRSSSSAPRTRT